MTIIAGGQTGVDQSALKAALEYNLNIGGWCPPGRVCEDGIIPGIYPLKETPHDRSDRAPDIPRSQRTEWNVKFSDATMIIKPQNYRNDAGLDWTIRCTEIYKKPLFIWTPDSADVMRRAQNWLKINHINILNIAGPSEKSSPGIKDVSFNLLAEFFSIMPI